MNMNCVASTTGKCLIHLLSLLGSESHDKCFR